MKDFFKNHISFRDAVIILLVIIAMAVYCQILSFPLIIPLLLLFLGLHLYFLCKVDMKLFLQIGLLLVLLVLMTNYIHLYTVFSPLFIPLASIVMLVMLLYNDLTLAFIMALATSIIVCLLLQKDLSLMLIFFLGNLTAIYAIRGARARGKIISAGIYVSIIQVAAMLLLLHEPTMFFSKNFYVYNLRPLAVSGVFSSLVVLALLKVFETWFGRLSNFSLLELTDFNQPLLKRMILEAPGTYHHSLVVSNIAEAAADAIGANSLLTRVGSYYHDIGKMEKPEYFAENQLLGGNKHDNIEPSISRLVILNHVKEGIELAHKYKLNPVILDFITQHHGTSLMYFFYQKALEDMEDRVSVNEESYRYPGPKPQTPEAAIVLLADSAEAATRSLEDPTPHKIEDLVRKIINNKFIDGQLDECNITLKEIEQIAKTFTRVLSAMYHGRVKYPEKKNGSDNRSQKQPEENSRPPAPG